MSGLSCGWRVLYVLTLSSLAWFPTAVAQMPTIDTASQNQAPAFEVVSIRPSLPATYPGATGGPSVAWGIQQDGYRTDHQTIWSTMMIAYFPQGMANWTPDRIQGAPAWLNNDQFDITAKVSAADLPAWKQQGNTLEHQELFRTMLQTMLADRCKLVVHRIPASVPGLELSVGKQGPSFKPTPEYEVIPKGMKMYGGGVAVDENDGHTIHFYGATMEDLAFYLSLFSSPQMTVKDRTNLSGKYDLVIPRPEGNSWSTQSWDVRSIGLEFKRVAVPTETLVIDHVEKPSEN